MRKRRERAIAFIAVGSNIEPQKNILAALMALQQEVHIVASSTFYRTEAIGRPDQPKFVNGVWCIDTDLPAAQMGHEVLKSVEARLGRVRAEDRFAPRTIDLDLVLYNDVQVSRDDLILSHPDIERPFVYLPIIELLSQECEWISTELRERIRRLLPQEPCATDVGEPLHKFTQQLRTRLRK